MRAFVLFEQVRVSRTHEPTTPGSTGRQPIIYPLTANFICLPPPSTDYAINTVWMRGADN